MILFPQQGEQGPQGTTGAQGAQGNQGVAGSQGSQGNQGAAGATGSQGPQGGDGANGPQGSQGDAGAAGAQGATGSQGPQGNQGYQGFQGDAGGPQGPQGDQGAQGTSGSPGPQGDQGASGSPGPQGSQGDQGSQGSQGNQGAQGNQGSPGSSGPQGAQGDQGSPGSTGPQGNQGASGATGPQGAQGDQGAQGSQGTQGNQGNQGYQGDVGAIPGTPAQGDIIYRGASSWERLAAAAYAGYSLESGGPSANPSWVLQGPHESLYRGTAGAMGTNFDRNPINITNLASILSSGRLTLDRIVLSRGQVLSGISFFSGSTALATGNNQWFGLFDSNRVPLVLTADDTSTAWGTNTKKSLAFASPYTVLANGWYYIGICINASTVPTLLGTTNNNRNGATGTASPICGGTSSTGLTNPASCPNPAGAITATVQIPYCEVY